MEITTILQETIKPSSPTPHHLRHWKLSLIDQCIPPTLYGRIVLFYSAQGDVHRFERTNMSDRLKRSLSVVLSDFYPLAGRFISSRLIDCNDDGLEYIEARVKAPLTLDQLVNRPKADELDQLVPYGEYTNQTGSRRLSAVQVTVFDACGGMAIGVSLSHILADASSAAAFIDSWAAIARTEGNTMTASKTVAAKLSLASLLPPRDLPAPQITDSDSTPQGASKIVTKMFVFPQLKIDTLKGKFKYQRPTRVEVVSALISKCLINVSNASSAKPVVLGSTIDLRTRMSPPLPAHYLGNMVLPLITKQIGPETSLNDLGVQLRQLTKEIDSDYLKKLRADDAILLWERLVQHVKLYTNNDVRIFILTSWCNFSFNAVDVGWGAPTWVAPAFVNGQDGVLLVDAKNGDGIEAWLIMEEDDMARFESELVDFTGPNPIISKL